MHIGDIQVDAVRDGQFFVPPARAYRALDAGAGRRGTSEEDWAPHREFLTEDGLLEVPLGGFLVRTGDRTVLVDLAVGRFAPQETAGNARAIGVTRPRTGGFLGELGALGVSPEDVTDVVFTHLHSDHIGYATRDGRPTFSHATYRCDAADWAWFMANDAEIADHLRPVEDRLEPWRGSGPIVPGIDGLAAPGHTPGSTVVVVSSGTDRAMILGDVAHCPIELMDDEWGAMFDIDADLAHRTRVALARELEREDVLVSGPHFPDMRFGRLLPGEAARSWVVP
jgi:glyoxylase-like metal-dependent hydrolase (beta-lactamase superfamily II)